MDRRAGEYIGKTVLTMAGERMGEIKNLTFDKYFRQLKNFVVFDDEQDEYHISLRSMYCHGENAVLVKINQYQPCANTFLSPLNVKAYDITGKLLGAVIDMKFDDDGKTVSTLILDSKEELKQLNIVSHGKDAVLFDFSEKPKKILIRKNVKKANKTDEIFLKSEQEITVLPVENKTEIQAAAIEPQKTDGGIIESVNIETNEKPQEIKEEIPKKPDNLVVGARLLTGRKVKKDIYLRNGKLLISEGTIITLPVVNLALNNAKLFELTVNSLGNLPI